MPITLEQKMGKRHANFQLKVFMFLKLFINDFFDSFEHCLVIRSIMIIIV